MANFHLGNRTCSKWSVLFSISCQRRHQLLRDLRRQSMARPRRNFPVNYSEPRDHTCRTSHPQISCHLLILGTFPEKQGFWSQPSWHLLMCLLRASLNNFLDTPFPSGLSHLPSHWHHPSAPEPAPYAPLTSAIRRLCTSLPSRHLPGLWVPCMGVCLHIWLWKCLLNPTMTGFLHPQYHRWSDHSSNICSQLQSNAHRLLLGGPCTPQVKLPPTTLNHWPVLSQPCPRIESWASGPCCKVIGTKIPSMVPTGPEKAVLNYLLKE